MNIAFGFEHVAGLLFRKTKPNGNINQRLDVADVPAFYEISFEKRFFRFILQIVFGCKNVKAGAPAKYLLESPYQGCRPGPPALLPS